LGNERRRFSGLTRSDRNAKNPPRRTNCGRTVVVLPSEHRHPENKAWLVAVQTAPQGADVTIQDAPPAFVRQVDSLLSARNLPAPTLAGGSLRRAIRRADDPPRRYPRKPRAVA
jgi:hypothetical protein